MRIAGFEEDDIFYLYLLESTLCFMSDQGQTFNGNQKPPNPLLCDHLQRLAEGYIEILESHHKL